MPMTKRLTSSLLLMGLIAGCETAPKGADAKASLSDDSDSAVKHMYREDPSFKSFVEAGAGYVVFPEVGKGGLIVGGSYGRGVVYQGGKAIGYADVSKGSVGAIAGGSTFTEIIVFQTNSALQDFKNGKFTVAADASAVALKEGASASAQYNNGVAVFTDSKGGLGIDASVGGQKFTYQAM